MISNSKLSILASNERTDHNEQQQQRRQRQQRESMEKIIIYRSAICDLKGNRYISSAMHLLCYSLLVSKNMEHEYISIRLHFIFFIIVRIYNIRMLDACDGNDGVHQMCTFHPYLRRLNVELVVCNKPINKHTHTQHCIELVLELTLTMLLLLS